MDALRWAVSQSREVKRNLRKYKSNKPVLDSFENAIRILVNEKDPAEVAYKKTADDICLYRLGRSIRMSYWMDYEKGIIHLGYLGNHKEVYGWD